LKKISENKIVKQQKFEIEKVLKDKGIVTLKGLGSACTTVFNLANTICKGDKYYQYIQSGLEKKDREYENKSILFKQYNKRF